MSEKFKIEEEGKRTILKCGGPVDLQVREPRSGWVAHKRSHTSTDRSVTILRLIAQ